LRVGPEWLNYHHLRYFWAAAREGGITRAAQKLHVAQPSLSAQIRRLEATLGEKLFTRSGRTVVLTEMGRLAFRYAEEIFGLGQEMVEAVAGRPTGRPARVRVGIANVIPKLIAYRLLEPALRLPEPVRLECLEDDPNSLLAELALHRLDVVLADTPVPPSVRIQAYSHLLGESGVSVFATKELAEDCRPGFPRSLDGAPVLLPTENTSQRRSLQQWFDKEEIRPRVIAEFEDSGLLKAFGEAGCGLFPAPSAVEQDVCRQYGVTVVGRIPIRERFYALTVQRRIRHPAVLAISEQARHALGRQTWSRANPRIG
jgi:LysR family transcriptional regulator, transcriptional activator of nhaA